MQQYHLLALTGLLFASTAIAQTSTVSVQGGVNRPGAYSIDPVGETLSTAIRKAGGVIPGVSRAVIYRADDHGVPHEIPVMLQPILDQRATDMALKPGDVVYLPAPGTKSPNRPSFPRTEVILRPDRGKPLTRVMQIPSFMQEFRQVEQNGHFCSRARCNKSGQLAQATPREPSKHRGAANVI